MEASYVLHRRQYRDTSLIIDIYSHGLGRVSVMAKGAYKSGSKLSALLQPFQPLLLSWQGRGELKTLTRCEAPTAALPMSGGHVYAGLYLNELLYRLLPPDESIPGVFELYAETLGLLSQREEIVPVVRGFEFYLLRAIGAIGALTEDWQGDPIERAQRYYLSKESTLVAKADLESDRDIGGELLLALAGNQTKGAGELHACLTDTVWQQREVGAFLSLLLANVLDGKSLASREMLRAFLKSSNH